ncbi:MAG: hypothetical protein AB1Z98_34425 [Nannocystaceae bacterium]
MTPQRTAPPQRESSPIDAKASRHQLPFEYEDRSDGRHARIMKEMLAARAWTRRQRELGLLPS